MPVFARSSAALLAFGLLVLMPDAHALSKRDQAAVDALNQRMGTAETRYREGLVKIANADPAGRTEVDAALEDMEDVMAACVKQKGCSPTTMLTAYKRLLKQNADVAAGDEVPEDNADEGAGSVTADVPEAARAAALLSDDGQQFLRQNMWPQVQRAGLPEALLFGVMAKESNGRVHSTSRAGAAGPMQFMYHTGRRFGLGDDGSGFDTRYDARLSAMAAAEYFNERLGVLNRSIELSLAAYNGGEGRAQRVYNSTGGRNFWDESVYNQFPAETRDYVPMVIAAAWLFLHPKEYGLTLPKVDARPAPLRLTRPSSIYELTICLGNGGTRDGFMRALRNLNPRYQADAWLPTGTTLSATTKIVGLYNRHCVQGQRAELAHTLVTSDAASAIVRTGPVTPIPDDDAVYEAESAGTGSAGAVVASAPAARGKPSRPSSYTVKRGETLTQIAQKFQCDTGDLAKVNKIKAPRFSIRPGQKLKLSGCEG
jgi:membrane-bound lytic murein transglycosylase D